MRQNDLRLFNLLLVLVLGISACVKAPKKTSMAEQHGFHKILIQTNPFLLTSYQRIQPGSQTLKIYIEGDGRAWISRHQLSTDPTPRQPLGLQLALQDSSASVAYLARPCQYTPHTLDAACQPAIWSHLRFSEPLVAAMNQAVTQLKTTAKAKKIQLVGFSGGAAIAVLIAARRNDIENLRTVAGDLNHDALSQYHATTPLTGSLNPTDVIAHISRIPQCHFSGEKDKTVPPFIATEFVDKINQQGFGCAEQVIIKNNTHHEVWERQWKNLLTLPLKCAPGMHPTKHMLY
jgi:hypothetical protein